MSPQISGLPATEEGIVGYLTSNVRDPYNGWGTIVSGVIARPEIIQVIEQKDAEIERLTKNLKETEQSLEREKWTSMQNARLVREYEDNFTFVPRIKYHDSGIDYGETEYDSDE